MTWEKGKLGQAGSLDENMLWEPDLHEMLKIAGFKTLESTGGILSLRTDLPLVGAHWILGVVLLLAVLAVRSNTARCVGRAFLLGARRK